MSFSNIDEESRMYENDERRTLTTKRILCRDCLKLTTTMIYFITGASPTIFPDSSSYQKERLIGKCVMGNEKNITRKCNIKSVVKFIHGRNEL